MNTEVLIAGAGPVGLMAACELARRGIDVRLIDKRSAPDTRSKALGVFARTLEVFADVGIIDDALAAGLRLVGGNFHANGRVIGRIGFSRLDTPYPFSLCLPQYDTERLLAGRAGDWGVTVERPIELVDFVQDANGVTSTLRGPTGEQTCRAAWLLGCDGAHSTVRKRSGIEFVGEDIPGVFTFVDARVDWPLPRDHIHAFFSPLGAIAAIALPQEEYWRVIVTNAADAELPEEPSLEHFQAALAERTGIRATLSDPLWRTRFEVHQRKVDRYRDGRVLLAGDAAHAHSPVGGQGMNTGLQDAFNLGWKLAMVHRRQADDRLLDTYTAEREPIARAVLAGTGLGTRTVAGRNPLLQAARNAAFEMLTRIPPVQRRIAPTLAELRVHYRGGSLACDGFSWLERLGGPRPGERAPDVDLGHGRLHEALAHESFTLLLFPGPGERAANLAGAARRVVEEYGDLIRGHVVASADVGPLAALDSTSAGRDRCRRRYRAGGGCFYLIRPDTYIAARGRGAGVLSRYLRGIVRSEASRT